MKCKFPIIFGQLINVSKAGKKIYKIQYKTCRIGYPDFKIVKCRVLEGIAVIVNFPVVSDKSPLDSNQNNSYVPLLNSREREYTEASQFMNRLHFYFCGVRKGRKKWRIFQK